MRTLQDEREEVEAENRKQCDARGIIRDGGRLRIPLFMADSAPDDRVLEDAFQRGYQRGLADAKRREGIQYNAKGEEISRWREREEEDSTSDARATAYADMCQSMSDAWQTKDDDPDPFVRAIAKRATVETFAEQWEHKPKATESITLSEKPASDARSESWHELQARTMSAWKETS
jgi:ribosome modulation factor